MTENELAVIEKLRRIGSHQITHERAIDALTTACAERDALRLMVKDDAAWAQDNEALTIERDALRSALRVWHSDEYIQLVIDAALRKKAP